MFDQYERTLNVNMRTKFTLTPTTEFAYEAKYYCYSFVLKMGVKKPIVKFIKKDISGGERLRCSLLILDGISLMEPT